ncbi:MAG: hypothetical protein C0613_08525 [Desulfobulbaceae bacterium]|nr:MAG: hypothetical protein C0613_08525 [Desulfobulbaceae bacterium]
MISHIDQLEQREKIFLGAGLLFLLAVALFYGILQPYAKAMQRADKSIAAKRLQLQELREVQAEYQALRNSMQRAEAKLAPATATSSLALAEDIATKAGSRQKILAIRPQPAQIQGEIVIENIDLKFEKLSLQDVVRLLQGVEGAPVHMLAKNLQIKQRFDDKSQLDMAMTISLFRRKQ